MGLKGKSNLLIENGYSVIPVKENKRPFGSWKKQQTEPYKYEDLESLLDSNKVSNIGVCTGYNGLEVIDVDTKVLSSLQEQRDFWNELLCFLEDNIDDFYKKFVIYKTKNKGYHILYRCSNPAGNKKIASLKGYTEAIIETRGVGGYVVVYDNKISELSYLDIQIISDSDRDILFEILETYNYIEDVQPIKTNVSKFDNEQELKTWDDYNNKTDIFDVIGSDFKIVRNLSDKYIIKRHGAESFSSGYVYKNSGCMYLFSTGTIYPTGELITPYLANTIRNYNGCFKSSAKALYNNGFGSRVLTRYDVTEKPKINKDDLCFPTGIFPKEIEFYISECSEKSNLSADWMGSSLVWLTSLIIGNSMRVHIDNSWSQGGSVWICVVGKAGLGKTPSINQIIKPLQKINGREIKNYDKEIQKFEHYESLSKKEKTQEVEVLKPVKKQFIANDITIEALVDLHQENPNSVGVFNDELAGWFNDMNKYTDGGDVQKWLSIWGNEPISLTRKTAKSSYVEMPNIPVLGGIQPSILSKFYNEENKDNGFMDRMLFSFPDMKVQYYNDNEIDEDLLEWYKEAIVGLYDHVKTNVLEFNKEGLISPLKVKYSEEAKKEFKSFDKKIVDKQNSDNINEYLKSMLPKQKNYVHRFALLINTLDSFFNNGDLYTISKENFLKSTKLCNYFINMATKIKGDSVHVNEIKTILRGSKKKSKKDRFKELYEVNSEVDKKEVAEILGVSLQTIYNWIKSFKEV